MKPTMTIITILNSYFSLLTAEPMIRMTDHDNIPQHEGAPHLEVPPQKASNSQLQTGHDPFQELAEEH